jgi:hypothetical protein
VTTPTPPGYASDPELEMLWTTPPEFIGLGDGSSSSTAPPMAASFSVSLPSVQSTESTMLTATSGLVTSYNPLESSVQSDISGGTIFGQQATYRVVPVGAEGSHGPAQWLADQPLQQAGEQFAEQINPAMTRALRLVADSVETIGIFIGMLNNAGQIYTTADKTSVLPAPPDPGS